MHGANRWCGGRCSWSGIGGRMHGKSVGHGALWMELGLRVDNGVRSSV